MSETVKIVATPYEEGKSKLQVRAALHEAFPNYRVSQILRDGEGEDERWLARLVESKDRVHHKLAEGDAPFPLKELGPGADDEDSDAKDKSDDDSDKDSDKEPKTNDDDDELEPDEKPAEDDKDNVKGELANLLKTLKKLLPEMEKVVGPIGDDEGPGDLDKALEDVGPVPGNGGPGGPAGLPPGPGGPPGPPADMPPRRPPAPPGAGRRPGGPPRPGVPAFTHAQTLPLQRTADVTKDEALQELATAYPDYEVSEIKEDAGLFKVILERKPTS
jgi:hypothetical protein